MADIKCLRCGKCCKDCKYLIKWNSGRTNCRIYNCRFNVEIRKGLFCVPRSQQKEIIEGCPYNVLQQL